MDTELDRDETAVADQARGKAIVGPYIVLGLGLGGFVDGILLHQVLQWHHMVSSAYPPTSLETLQLNTLADGLFHVLTWSLTVIGLLWLWRTVGQPNHDWSTPAFLGGLLAGWGLFNILDEIVNHRLLGWHHIREGQNEFFWDMVFFVFGVLLLLIGTYLIRRYRRA